MRGELHYDAVVIGAGTAGLTAATRLAQSGARVCVLAKGIGSTHLAPGTIDVLGYAPERIEAPRLALEALAAERPDHPYARTGIERVAGALGWWREQVAAGPLAGYGYLGDLERNRRVPTALGVLRPSALVPVSMAAGDPHGRQSPARVCVVGLRALRDFHAGLCAGNLREAGIDARAIELAPEVERADQNALGFARRFDDPAWRSVFCAELAGQLRGEEVVAVPAVLGLDDPHGAWSTLEQRLGRPVFEIPTLPPSAPGMRMFEILRCALRTAGGRLVLGSEVVKAERDGSRVTGVLARTAGGDKRYVASWYVLASGGFTSGAIDLDSHWQAHERVFSLKLSKLPEAENPCFSATYLDEQPLARVGVAVDECLRAVDRENVVVVGAALPGAVSWREGSGEGIALTTGLMAAEVVAGPVAAKPAGAAA